MIQVTNHPKNMNRFLVIWIGQLISLVGSGMTSFALGVWVLEQTGQATPFTMIILLSSLARILLAPLAGSLADRWNRRSLMILADTGDALVTLATALLLFSGRLAIWQVALLAPLGAAFTALQSPAYAASISMLVPKRDLPRANGLIQMGQAIETLVSPALAGMLFGWVGLQGIAVIDFVTYFFAIGALLLVRIPQPPRVAAGGKASRGKLGQEIGFGWQYLRQRPGLFGLLIYFALANFALNFAVVLLGPLVLSFGTPDTLGLLRAICGAGMLAGSVAMSAWGGPQRRVPWVIGFVGLGAVGLFAAGLRPTVGVIGGGLFGLLFCIPLAAGMSQVVLQTKVEPGVQGRVMAAGNMLSQSAMPLAFLSAGPLADYVFEPLMREGGALATTLAGRLLGVGPGRGIGLLFAISGLTLILTSLLAYASPRVRHLEEELPDAVAGTEVGHPVTEPATVAAP